MLIIYSIKRFEVIKRYLSIIIIIKERRDILDVPRLFLCDLPLKFRSQQAGWNDACCKFLQGSNTSEYDWKLHRLAM